MFYSLSGTLVHKDETAAVIDTGGTAYELLVSERVARGLPDTGAAATLFTRLIVREDDMYLVGFATLDERRLYDTLMTVSGIGPKQALKVLSDMTPGEVREAIVNKNTAAFSRVKGVGPKTAARIMLELEDKIRKLQLTEAPEKAPAGGKRRLEAALAMRVLGYTDSESRRAVDDAIAALPALENADTEAIIKAALARMAR